MAGLPAPRAVFGHGLTILTDMALKGFGREQDNQDLEDDRGEKAEPRRYALLTLIRQSLTACSRLYSSFEMHLLPS